MKNETMREKQSTDTILLSSGDGTHALEVIMTSDGEFYEYNYQTHFGLVSTEKIEEIREYKYYDKLKNNIIYFSDIKNHVLYNFLTSIPLLPYVDSVGGDLSNGTDIMILENLYGGEALNFKNPLEKLLIEKLVKKGYTLNSKMYIPRIAPKLVKFMMGRIKIWDKIVRDPNKIDLDTGDKKNIADEAIDMDFVKYMTQYIGLKDSTLEMMILAYKPKNKPKQFKTKVRKRRRR